MDQMVFQVQHWLNTTYGNNPNYTTIKEDGVTGGTTVAALITALQIEIGISAPDGVLGPATQAACPTLSSTSGTKNEICILQGALYCKGYNPNGIDGVYGNGVITAIKKFQSDAGLTTQDGITTPMIFKAILNTDAYTLISGGDSNIKTIQQNLNRDYNSIIGLIPSNGVYSKSTNVALIKALQHEEGNTTDGIWGTNTMNTCPTIPGSKSTTKFVLLLQYSLYCNGYNPNGFDGLYGNGIKTAVINFQTFVGLTADGYAGPSTWASLLVSYGDPNRKGTACDCSTAIIPEKAATLIANGYKVVGRYLTGNYAITLDELEIIFNNNLGVIPIFEVGGYKLDYFSSSQGTSDAESAVLAANYLNFPDNTTIYFAVDFDALDTDVTNKIIPYFSAINDRFQRLDSPYKIGIYAPRNVCIRVASAGYSCSSFICDMSSGFSGNLGYKLPGDWAFDQISTKTFGSGTSSIEIDNNICSGKNNGITSVSDIPYILELIKGLENAAVKFINSTSESSPAWKLVLDFLRHIRYNSTEWTVTYKFGAANEQFINYVQDYYQDLCSKLDYYIMDGAPTAMAYGNYIDVAHLAATTQGYITSLVPSFWTGWGGDLATAMNDVTNLVKNGANSLNSAIDVIGNNKYSFGIDDMHVDIDAIKLASLLNNPNVSIYNLLVEYYKNDYKNRLNYILGDIGFNSVPSLSELSDKIYDKMTGAEEIAVLLPTKAKIVGVNQVVTDTCYAFAMYLLNL